MQGSKKSKKSDDLPPKLEKEIMNNGVAMQQFYELPTAKRQDVLDAISETNKKLDSLDQ
jgi:hypothetical protein